MTNQQNWYKYFFNGLALEMWDHALPASFTQAEAKFIEEAASLPKGSTVLDVPCGSGRISLPLAENGFHVTGIDIAEGNIQTLEKMKGSLPIQTVCADLLEYVWKDQFDLAICMGNSFSYFEYDAMVEFARQVKRALKPGAKFIINSGSVAEGLIPNLKDKMEMHVGDILFKIENQYVTGESVLKTRMEFIKGDMKEERTSFHFVYTLAEIKRMLSAAGFSNFIVYSGIDKADFLLGSHQAYIIAD